MAASFSNFEGVLELTAPAGGVIAGTFLYDSTAKMAIFPLSTATSGNTYSGRLQGYVKNAPKVTGAAWTIGRCLKYTGGKFASCTGGASQATAMTAAASSATTGDILLRLPCGGLA